MRGCLIVPLVCLVAACSGRERTPPPETLEATSEARPPGAQTDPPASHPEELARELERLGYLELFQRATHAEVDRLWATPSAPAKLRAVLRSSAASGVSRFLAAEILFLKDGAFPDASDRRTLALVYAKALQGTGGANPFHLNGNVWGFLYPEDDPGRLGAKLIGLGEVAREPLRGLLSDASHVLYEGSEEATIGNGYRYRVKDFAAFYLSKITSVPITFHQELAQRDAEIAAFEARLGRR